MSATLDRTDPQPPWSELERGEAGGSLFGLERLRTAGDESLALDSAWLQAGLAAPLFFADRSVASPSALWLGPTN